MTSPVSPDAANPACEKCKRTSVPVGPWREPGSPYRNLCGKCKFEEAWTPQHKAEFEADLQANLSEAHRRGIL